MLRALPLCTCCRQYPGAATGVRHRSLHPVVSAFPDKLVGSACATSFSRLARRSLALRPAHSRCHRISWHASPEASTVSLPPQLLRLLPAGAGCRVGLSPTEKAPPYHGAQPERTSAKSLTWIGFGQLRKFERSPFSRLATTASVADAALRNATRPLPSPDAATLASDTVLDSSGRWRVKWRCAETMTPKRCGAGRG